MLVAGSAIFGAAEGVAAAMNHLRGTLLPSPRTRGRGVGGEGAALPLTPYPSPPSTGERGVYICTNMTSTEHERLSEVRNDHSGWRRWGPYVSDRAWATVREDYSADGNAWEYFPHDLARSKAYRWGEDGIAGHLRPLPAPRLRAGVLERPRSRSSRSGSSASTAHEGNHGEDVKEYYFHLDNMPTHSYMKFLYKYPQAEFPYAQLVEENRRRTAGDLEFELLDTGIFDEDRYFDIVIEYAKVTTGGHLHPDRGVQPRPRAGAAAHPAAPLVSQHLGLGRRQPCTRAAGSRPGPTGPDFVSLVTDDSASRRSTNDSRALPARAADALRPAGRQAAVHRQRDEHAPRLRPGQSQSRKPYVKDAFHRHIIHGEDCINPDADRHQGRRSLSVRRVPPGGSRRPPPPADATCRTSPIRSPRSTT